MRIWRDSRQRQSKVSDWRVRADRQIPEIQQHRPFEAEGKREYMWQVMEKNVTVGRWIESKDYDYL